MKKTIALSILLLNSICALAQEKEFIVNENIKDVDTKVSKFQSSISSGISFGSSNDEMSETDIVIKDEEYPSENAKNYLKQTNTSSKNRLEITSTWNVQLHKINNNSTKVSVLLQNTNNKKYKFISSGKLEEELKNYINSHSIDEFKEELEPREGDSIFAEYASSDNDFGDFTDTAQAADSKDVTDEYPYLKNLVNNNDITLPTTVEYFTKKIGFKPETIENELCEKGVYYHWYFEPEVSVIYSRLKDKSQSYGISYFGNYKIKNLPLGLSFNDITFYECKSKFAKYNPNAYQTTESVSDLESRVISVIDFKTQKYYVRLGFYNNEYLTSILISTSKID